MGGGYTPPIPRSLIQLCSLNSKGLWMLTFVTEGVGRSIAISYVKTSNKIGIVFFNDMKPRLMQITRKVGYANKGAILRNFEGTDALWAGRRML